MTREEFAKITLTIKGCYQKETNLFQSEQIVKLWYEHLKDLDYMTLQVALSAWIDTNKWSPSIADLREMCIKVQDNTPEDWSEAWEKVVYAINMYGRDRKAEAMQVFDEITRTVIDRIGWYNICTSEDISIERANFRQIFQVVKKKHTETKQLHPAIRKVIEATKENNRKLLEARAEDKPEVPKVEEPIAEYDENLREKIEQARKKIKGV